MMNFAALALFAALQPGGDAVDCRDPVTQADMNECAARDFLAADVALNAAWGEALRVVRAADAEPVDDGGPGYEETLREAQRGWVAFRDAHCRLEGYEARGGSMESMIYDGCRAELTRERVRQLAAHSGQ
jgi:uncharacterized protein YecT (DUF1311 family)